jgi:6-pyruvoyltetrahydropterin/6-carboxytetrahydropterin synthase
MDFGLMQDFKAVVDAFDHSHIIWREDNSRYREFFMQENERWILSEFNPSAEILSLIFFYFFDRIIKNTEFSNDEGKISVKSVRVHETDTGYAECNRKDFEMFLNQIGNKVIISFSLALREFLPKTVLNIKRIIPPPHKLIKQDEYLNNLNLSTHG